MTKTELLQALHEDNKEINRNLQRINQSLLAGLLFFAGLHAKNNGDEKGMKNAKAGLHLLALADILLLVQSIADNKNKVH